MKIRLDKSNRINRRDTQSIFESNEEELRQNLLRYNIEKNIIKNNVEKERKNLDFFLSNHFSPGLPELDEPYWPSIRLSYTIRQVVILANEGKPNEAIDFAYQTLASMEFPQSVNPNKNQLVTDTQIEGKLRLTLASLLISEGNQDETAKELCKVIDIFVRELNLFDLMHSVTTIERHSPPKLSTLVREIAKSIPRMGAMPRDEVVYTLICLVNGNGLKKDLDRVLYLLSKSDWFSLIRG